MSTYWYDDQRFQEELEREERARARARRKKTERRRRIAGTVAAALIFGTVAGGTAFGVNRMMNDYLTDVESAEAAVSAGAVQTGESTYAGGDDGAAVGELASVGSTEAKTPMSVEQVAAEAMPSMVTISTLSVQEMQSYYGSFGGFGGFGGFGPGSTQEYEVQGAGTGEIIANKGGWLYIATNEHVISGAKEVSVGFVDGTAAEAQIVGEDAENDLAVVAVRVSDLSEDTLSQISVIAIGDSDDLVLGEQVVAIGNALGYGQSVTGGVVSALDRELSFGDGYETSTSTGLIQTDAAINSGNSGGALLNMYGELIGINEAKSSTTASGVTVDNMGFAIPISKALPILRQMIGDAV